VIRYRLLGHHRTVVRSAHGPIGMWMCAAPARPRRHAACALRPGMSAGRSALVALCLYMGTSMKAVLRPAIEAPEEPRTGVGGEPRRHLRTRSTQVFLFGKKPSQLRAGSILPSLASSCTRAQYSTIKVPPPPLIRSSAARMASPSSGQAGKKVSPHAVHATAFPPPAPSRPDCTPMIMLSQQPPLDACCRSSPTAM
jgi:hypothetical protein